MVYPLLAVVLALCCRAVAGHKGATSRSRSLLRLWAEELQGDNGTSVKKESPFRRVVDLLQEMKAQLETEATEDATAHDKMACWCETNEKEKTKAVADADSRISQLESEVERRSGRGGQLGVEIEALKRELAAKKQALAEAIALREREQAEFNAQEVEIVQAVAMLRDAIVVLSRHNAGLLQLTPAVQASLGAALRWAALRRDELRAMAVERGSSLAPGTPRAGGHPQGLRLGLLGGRASSHGGGGSAAFLSMPASAGATSVERTVWGALSGGRASVMPAKFAARVLSAAAAASSGQGASLVQHAAWQPAGFQSYASQSGQVFGVLKQMQEEFEATLSESQKQELKAQQEFVELKAVAEKAIDASAAKLDEIETEFGANTKALFDAKEDLTKTRETRAADVQFLSDLNLKCKDLDHQWKQRSTSRAEEIKAVAETIAILTEDDAREMFIKKLGAASFLQVASSSQAEALRNRAASMLLRAARSVASSGTFKGPDPLQNRLVALAVQVQLDPFTKVKEAIDLLVGELKTQQEEEVKQKAFCTSSLNDNEKETYHAQKEASDLKDNIEALADTIEKLNADITAAGEAVVDLQVQIKAAGELRARENRVFQEQVTDQTAIQNILQKAIARMRAVYKPTALLQEEPVSPVQFQPYKQNAGASPVISLMEQIVEDSKKLEGEAVSAEQEAQSTYEAFIKDANGSIRSLQEVIERKTGEAAQAGVEKAERESELKSTEDRLQGLAYVADDLHAQCDFVLKNFDIRQTARQQEIEALGNVKAFLSGMKDAGDAEGQ